MFIADFWCCVVVYVCVCSGLVLTSLFWGLRVLDDCCFDCGWWYLYTALVAVIVVSLDVCF